MSFTLKEVMVGFIFVFTMGTTVGVGTYQFTEMRKDVVAIKSTTKTIQKRQYALLTVAINRGWKIPQEILGRAIMDGWQPHEAVHDAPDL